MAQWHNGALVAPSPTERTAAEAGDAFPVRVTLGPNHVLQWPGLAGGAARPPAVPAPCAVRPRPPEVCWTAAPLCRSGGKGESPPLGLPVALVPPF